MKNWKKKAKGLLSLLLCASVLMTSLPLQAYAREEQNGAPETQTEASDLAMRQNREPEKTPVIVGESTLERDAYTKHFTTSDRSYVAAVYEEPVHFQKEEEWENIDNRLELKEEGENGPVYTNKASDVGVQFVKTSGDDALVRVAWKGDSISWGLKANGGSAPSKPNEPVASGKASANSEATGSAAESSSAPEAQASSAVSSAESEANGAQPKAAARALPEETEEGSSSSESGLSSEDSVPPSSSEAESNSQPVPEEPKQPVPVRPSEFLVNPPEEPVALFSDVNPEELTDSAEIEAYNRQKTAVTNLTSSGKYEEILPGIDLQYILHSNAIKENIIVKNREAVSLLPLSFTIDHTGLSIRKEEDGSLSLYKEEEPEKAIFTFLAPFMSDANGVTSYGVEYALSEGETAGQSVLTVLPDMDWLNAEERAFPLIIDPVTKTETSSNIPIKEAFVTQADPYTNFGNVEFMTTGNTGTGKKTRSLIQFDNLPELGNRATIRRAYLRLTTFDTEGAGFVYNPPLRNPYQDGKTVQVNAYEMTKAWDAHAVTWNNMWPEYDGWYYNNNALDYARVDKHAQYHWDITRAVKHWYRDPSDNYGIMLTNDSETATGERIFWATSDWALVNEKEEYKKLYYPIVELLYSNSAGLEDYWSYHQQDVGRAGSGHVNDYTGNVTFVHDDTTTPGTRMPVTISHIFNNTQAGWNSVIHPKNANTGTGEFFPRTGMGWKLNIQQSLVSVDSSMGLTEEYKYVYTDGDGTEHYFYEHDGKIIDEDGLGLEVTDGGRQIKTKDKSILYFDGKGRLTDIKDPNGNTTNIHYGIVGGNEAIDFVKDGAGNKITFRIDASNMMLTGLIDQAGRETSFHYNSSNTWPYKYLEEITYPDDTSSSYDYQRVSGYDQYLLTQAKNAEGYRVIYEYNPLRQAKLVSEYMGNSPGQALRIDYGSGNTTTFRTSGKDDAIGNSDDVLTTYTFNNDGQTKSVSSELADGAHLGGSNYEYTSPSGKTGDQKQNRVKTTASVGKNVVNLIKNHNAETEGAAWERNVIGDWGANTFTYDRKNYMGYKSLKIAKTASSQQSRAYWIQDVKGLETGKTYTLSAYVSFQGQEKAGVFLGAGYDLSGGGYHIDYSDPVFDGSGTGWERLTLTFTLPENRTGDSVWVYLFYDTQTAGEAWFDCVQLEEGETANPYNLVENAGFEFNSSGSPENWQESYVDHNEVSLESGKFGRAVSIAGNPSNTPGIWQLCNITATEKDTFILSAWGRADSLPGTKADATFQASVAVLYSDGFQKWVYAPFNLDSNSWQFVSKAFTLDDGTSYDRTPVSIRVYVDYMSNMNRAWFDNIQLIKDEAPTYDYDNKGNLVSATQRQEDSQFAYGDDNLTKMVDSKGNFTYYNYNHNTGTLRGARTRQGVDYTFGHDSYGNVTSTVIQGNPLDFDPLALQTFYIRNKRSGLFIDIYGGASEYGQKVGQYSAHKSKNQTFQITGHEEGSGVQCMIEAQHASDVGFGVGSADNGAKVVTKPAIGTDQSKWTLEYHSEDGSYSFKNKYSGKYLDLETASDDSNVLLVQRDYDGASPSQRWYLEPADTKNDKITSSATYAGNGAFQDTVTNNRGYKTKYEYDQSKGTLTSVTENSGLGTARTLNYTYDPNNDKLLSVSQKVGTQTLTNRYTYERDRLMSIQHNGFSYNFTYDSWDNPYETKVGSQVLMRNEYAGGNGKLKESFYGNGDWIGYGYDSQERMTQKINNGVLDFEWVYNNRGQTAKHRDLVNGVDYEYTYDSLGRLITSKGSDGQRLNYVYDVQGRVTDTDFRFGGIQLGTASWFNLYDQTTVKWNHYNEGAANCSYYDYDSLGRTTKIRLYDYDKAGYLNERNYEYLSPSAGKTSTLVSKYTVGDTAYTYDYDSFDNIKKVYENGVETASYEYDGLSQLVRENNKYLNKTVTYQYDLGGNLTSRKEYAYTTGTLGAVQKTDSYAYGDSNWKDKLTSFSGQAITYDEIGNPLSYRDGWHFTWKNGRKLATAQKSGYTISYKYNADGLRTEKTVNGKATKYYYEGSKLLGEQKEGVNLYYFYDSDGQMMGLRYNGVNYYPLRNLQGDVVALTDYNGNKVVEYVYDSWGKVESVTGNLKDTLGKDNPIRYRGYYYDEETGLYYLQSRYYDPATCRFVNADNITDGGAGLLANNLFAYVANNPINYGDPTGQNLLDIIQQALANIAHAAKNAAKIVLRKAAQRTKTVMTAMKKISQTKTGTHTMGINLSGAFGVEGAGSIGLASDKKGNIALQITGCAGGGTPSASAMFYRTFTNASDVDKLNGRSLQVGGSCDVFGASLGGEAIIFNDSVTGEVLHGGTAMVGFGAPIPAELHGEVAYTKTLYQVNIYDLFDVFYNKIMED